MSTTHEPLRNDLPVDWVYPGWTLEWLLRCAKDERCCFEHYWRQGALLSAEDQLKLARALEQIKPASLPNGHPCEQQFRMTRRHKQRIAEAAADEGGDGKDFVRRARAERTCECGCGSEFVPTSGRQRYANPQHAQWGRNAKRRPAIAGKAENGV